MEKQHGGLHQDYNMGMRTNRDFQNLCICWLHATHSSKIIIAWHITTDCSNFFFFTVGVLILTKERLNLETDPRSKINEVKAYVSFLWWQLKFIKQWQWQPIAGLSFFFFGLKDKRFVPWLCCWDLLSVKQQLFSKHTSFYLPLTSSETCVFLNHQSDKADYCCFLL